MLPPFVPIPNDGGTIFIDKKRQPSPVQTSVWPKAWNATEGLIVYVTDQIVCTQFEYGKIVSENRFLIPDLFEALCVFFAFDCIFIGGRGGEQKIICIRAEDFQAQEVEHPNILKKYRKSIDDFIVWNDLLYAIDNHIHPKYLLGYRCQGNMWKCLDRIKLKGHAPEERVKAGLLWGRTLVLLSRSSHRAGTTTYISLYPDLQFDRYLCWHKTLGSTGITEISKMRIFQDELLLVTNVGVFLLAKGGTEVDVRCVCSQKYLIDVYPSNDRPWVGIIAKFGKKKKILIQPNEDNG